MSSFVNKWSTSNGEEGADLASVVPSSHGSGQVVRSSRELEHVPHSSVQFDPQSDEHHQRIELIEILSIADNSNKSRVVLL